VVPASSCLAICQVPHEYWSIGLALFCAAFLLAVGYGIVGAQCPRLVRIPKLPPVFQALGHGFVDVDLL